MTHLNPYGTPTPPYGINPYGGIPYYPPNLGTHYPNSPTFLAPPPPQAGGITPPQFMNPIPQQSMELLGYAQNHSYNPHCNEGTYMSYTLYGPTQHINPYYPFPGPPSPNLIPPQVQSQVGVNFFQPSPIQQVQALEQLNMVNPATL